MKRLFILATLLAFSVTTATAQRILPIVGGTVTANVADGTDFQVKLTANVSTMTLVSVTGTAQVSVAIPNGLIISFRFVQDSTGGRTVSFPSGVTSSCSVTSTANAITICRWQYSASGSTWADAGGGGGAPAYQIDPRTYGAKEDTRYYYGSICTISVTNTSTQFTISCPASSVLPSSSDAGKQIDITNWCCNTSIAGSVAAISMIPANTTISSVSGSGTVTVTMSNAATGSCTTSCAIAIGTDDSSALTQTSSALGTYAGCATVHFVGFSWTKTAQFNSISPTCFQSASYTDAYGGNWITGEASSTSGIYVDGASFNYSSCTGHAGSDTNVCFGAGIGGGRDFAIYGLGFSGSGRTDAVTGFEGTGGGGSIISHNLTDVAFLDWMGGDPGSGPGTNVGFKMTQAATLTHVSVVGFGNSACQYGGAASTPTVVNGGACSNTAATNLGVVGPLKTTGLIIGQNSNGSATVQVNNSGGGSWNSRGDYIYGSTSLNSLVQVTQGVVYFDDLTADNSGVANGNGVYIGATGEVHMKNSIAKGGTGTGSGVTVAVSGGKFDDQGRNTINTFKAVSGTTVTGIPGSVLVGTCTGAVTSAATVGLYTLGQFSGTACTQTTVNLGYLMKAAGTISGLVCSAGTAGNQATDACTIVKNGVAQTMTCSLNGATFCSTNSNQVSYVVGDNIAVEVVGGTSTTLANVTATVVAN